MPLIESGPALVASAAISAALALVFWVLAARAFTPAEVGVGAALISTVVALADLGQLGLRSGLARFLPMAGPDAERLLVRAYAVAAAGAGVGAAAFVVGVDWWAPELAEIRRSWAALVLFVAVTIGRGVLLLGDSGLVGTRLARWVPVEHGLFGLANILLVPILAGSAGSLGVFLAWSVPVLVAVAIVNGLLVRTLRARQQPARRSSPQTLARVLGFSLGDWSGRVARTAVAGMLPLLVLAHRGPDETAFFVVAWTIALGVAVLSADLGHALVAEAGDDEGNVDRRTLRGGALGMLIAAPLVALAVLVAPAVLGLFGPAYAEQGATVLRLLLVAALPGVVIRTWVGRLRAERRTAMVVGYETALAVAVAALSWLLVGPLGVDGVGLAWLVGLMAGAAVAAVVESVWWWAPRLDAGKVRFVTLNGRRLRRAKQRRPVLASRRELNGVVNQLYTSRPSWRRERFSSESQMVLVSGHEGRPPLQVEVARSPWGAELLARRVDAIANLGELTGLSSFRALLPYPIEHHTGPGAAYLVESAHSGRLGHHLAGLAPTDDLVREVVEAITLLHGATGGVVTLDHEALERWVSRPVRDLRKAGLVPPDQLQHIERVITRSLAGSTVISARLHGNLVLANTRFDSRNRLTGITGWEWSASGPVLLDRGSLAISARAAERGLDLGAVVGGLVADPESMFEDPAFDGYDRDGLDARAAVLLCWLHVLAPAISGPADSHPGRYWFARSVRAVANRLPASEPAAP